MIVLALGRGEPGEVNRALIVLAHGRGDLGDGRPRPWAETLQLEVQVSGLERDLGKSGSALFRMKKEKKAKASEVRRLQRQIQSQEEPRTREPVGPLSRGTSFMPA